MVVLVVMSTSRLSEGEQVVVLLWLSAAVSTSTSPQSDGELEVVVVSPTALVSTSTSPQSERVFVVVWCRRRLWCRFFQQH